MVEFQWGAVLLATALAFVLGGLWYGPLFGRAWMAAHNFTEADLARDFKPLRTYGLTALLALASALAFAVFLARISHPCSSRGRGNRAVTGCTQ